MLPEGEGTIMDDRYSKLAQLVIKRRGGEVYLDGRMVYLNGQWLTAMPSWTEACS